jgi:hypothetical protein
MLKEIKKRKHKCEGHSATVHNLIGIEKRM